MHVYKNLLLSAGGGITSPERHLKQKENTVSIYIGLGGQGVDAIRRLKTKVYSEICSDTELYPFYERILFLGIDSDSYSNKIDCEVRRLDLSKDEYLYITNPNIPVKVLKELPEFQWLDTNITWPGFPYGAGGIRQVGRCFMMNRSEEFIKILYHKIQKACEGLLHPRIEIYVTSGLCGGTGSGIFLDVCYMARHVLEKLEKEYKLSSRIYGYFFMPDVLLSHLQPWKNEPYGYMLQNAFAALKELDDCMQISKEKGSFTQAYQGGVQIEWNQPPVDFCFLAGGVDNYGHRVSYDYVLDNCAAYMFNSLTNEKLMLYNKN